MLLKNLFISLAEPFYLNVLLPFMERNGLILYSSGGGGGGDAPEQKVQTNVPEYAQPYMEDVLARAQAESYRQYTPYPGQRTADWDPNQLATQYEIAGMQTPGQFGQGSDLIRQGAALSGQYGAQGAGNSEASITMGFDARDTGQLALPFGQSGFELGQQGAAAGQNYANIATDPASMQAYMSPYMQNVVDLQKEEALRDAQTNNLTANLGAARSGSYGGARNLLSSMERERNLNQNMANIQAAGTQQAYEQAIQQQQFGADLGLRGINTGIQGAQTGIQGVQTAVDAHRYGLQGLQQGIEGARLGLQGADQMARAGTSLADIGRMQQSADLQRLQAQDAMGLQRQQYEQSMLDQQYADFLRQRDYPREQLAFMSNILRGQSPNLRSTSTSYAPPPSLGSQLVGAGLAGLGMYNMSQ